MNPNLFVMGWGNFQVHTINKYDSFNLNTMRLKGVEVEKRAEIGVLLRDS